MNICIIPARGGSKRIPRKNIKLFLGRPIISYAINTALKSGIFDHVVVSTDDEEISKISQHYGAETPFTRPESLSNDDASTDPVLKHAVLECQNIYGDFEYGCCIYPTNPLLSSLDLQKGFDLLKKNGSATSFPIVKYDFPIEQAFRFDGLKVDAVFPGSLLSRSQDLVEHYHDAGMFYCFNTKKFLNIGEIFCTNSVSFEIQQEKCQDINTESDWVSAEFKYKALYQSKNHG
jgi:N-acylneuraminate cytidylyltransferase